MCACCSLMLILIIGVMQVAGRAHGCGDDNVAMDR